MIQTAVNVNLEADSVVDCLLSVGKNHTSVSAQRDMLVRILAMCSFFASGAGKVLSRSGVHRERAT